MENKNKLPILSVGIDKIVALCIAIQNAGKATAFFEIEGHVQSICVRLYIPHWVPCTRPTHQWSSYTEDGEDLSSIIKELESFL
jgi:hypothetical protein